MTDVPALELAPLTARHWEAVRAIYVEGIATGNATFETAAPDWAKWDAAHLQHTRLVVCSSGEVVGWAALSPVSTRAVYAGVAEVSVYVAARARGQGAGRKLLAALIEESEHNGIWTLQAGIFAENIASIELHRKVGFRVVGVRERIGRLHDYWRDVQLLELRSATIGA